MNETMRILARISIFGRKAVIDEIASLAGIRNGEIMQCGLLRKPPLIDSWHYSTTWFRFNFNHLDEEMLSFLDAHSVLEHVLPPRSREVEYAQVTLCPVGQTYEHELSFYLKPETLRRLCRMGLALELAPAVRMPDAPYWLKEDK
jgi:hypothetical protein